MSKTSHDLDELTMQMVERLNDMDSGGRWRVVEIEEGEVQLENQDRDVLQKTTYSLVRELIE